MGGALVPAVGGPGVVDEVPDGDDGVGQGDECLDHPGAHLGTDLEPAEAAGVPGVGAFGHPAPTGLQRGASGGDPGLAAQYLEQLAGLAAVVAGIQVHGDMFGQVEAEPAQTLQGRCQQRRVMTVGRGYLHPDGDAVALDHD